MLLCPHHQPRDWLLFNFFLLSLTHYVPQREDRVEQALPRQSPIHTWASCPAQHSPTTLAHGKTRQMPTLSRHFWVHPFLPHNSTHGSEKKSAQTAPFTPQMPREPGQSHGSSHVSLGTTTPS